MLRSEAAAYYTYECAVAEKRGMNDPTNNAVEMGEQ